MSVPERGRERLISRAFVALADTLVDEYDVIDLLNHLVAYSVELLDADAAGIMLVDGHGQLHAVAASSEDAELMELLQLQAEQGPCVDCFHNSVPVSAPNLAETTDRWPRFATSVQQRGAFASVHAVPLRLRGQAIGALNLLHRTPGSLSDDELALGQAPADIATIGILQERAIRRSEVVNEQLQTALTSRVVIEQAKGVLAQHSGLAVDEVFTQLRDYVRSHSLRLAEVARALAIGEPDPRVVFRQPTTALPPPAYVRRRKP
jgi:GAF domain-containing protein